MKHLHLELQFQDADFKRLKDAWQALLQRHALLQCASTEPGVHAQSNTEYEIKLYDLSLQPADKIAAVQDRLRQQETPLNANTWPWFDIAATRYDSGDIRLYCKFAREMLSAEQLFYLQRELIALYQQPELALKSLTLTKPEVPTPLNEKAYSLYYRHLFGRLDHTCLTNLRAQSAEHNVSLPIVLLNTFSQELEKQNYSYPLRMSLANRFPFYPFMYDRACFATSVATCDIKSTQPLNVLQNCTDIESHLRQASLKITPDTVDELISLPKNLDAMALFSCNLEQDLPTGPMFSKLPDIIFCNFNLPTVDIDFNVWEQGGQLLYRWTYAKALPQIDSSITGSLLNQAYAAHPELKEIVANNESVKKSKTGPLKAAALVLAGVAGASQAKGKLKSNILKAGSAVSAGVLIQQAAQKNSSMDEAFDSMGQNMLAMSNHKNKWNQEDAEPKSQAQQNPDSASALASGSTTGVAALNNDDNASEETIDAVGYSTAASLLTKAIQDLQNTDNSPAELPEAPQSNELQDMPPEEIDAAYDDYSARVVKAHRAPSKSDLAQTDMCAQFSAMTGDLGPNALAMKDDLADMGKTMDGVSSAMAKGDLTAAGAGLDTLGIQQPAVMAKAANLSPQAAIEKNPLSGAVEQMMDASTALQSTPDEACLNGLDEKVTEAEACVGGLEEKIKVENASDKLMEASKYNEAGDAAFNNPQVQKIKADADTLQGNITEYSGYSCQYITENWEEVHEKLTGLKAKASDLAESVSAVPLATLTSPVNAAADSINETVTAINARKEQLTSMQPDMAMQDSQLQGLMQKLDTQCDTFAQNVQGGCPICSASTPNGPSLPGCGHNHADALSTTNSLQMPTLMLSNIIGALDVLKMPSNLVNPLAGIVTKLGSLLARMQALNPLAGLTGYAEALAPTSGTPYPALLSTTSAMLQKLLSQHDKLLSCGGYNALQAPTYLEKANQGPGDVQASTGKKQESCRQLVENSQSDLDSVKQRLTLLAEGNDTDGTNSRLDSMKEGMKADASSKAGALTSQSNSKLNSYVAAGISSSKAKALSSVECWKEMQLPQNSLGKPDEMLVSGFQLMCPSALPPKPTKIMVPPNKVEISNKPVLLVNPAQPLMQNMGQCIKFDKTKPIPCCCTIMASGGSKKTALLGLNVATKASTQFKCALGETLKLVDTGQTGKDKVTTS
jgi:hypothetical protein